MPALPGAGEGRPTKGRVLFIGASYYNNWYLSRALRDLGWSADTFTFGGEGAESYLHGTDFYLKDFSAFKPWDNADPEQTELYHQIQILSKHYRRWVRRGTHLPSPWGWRRDDHHTFWQHLARSTEHSWRAVRPLASTPFELLVELQREEDPVRLRDLTTRFLATVQPDPPKEIEPLYHLHERYDVVHFTAINNLRWFHYLNPFCFDSMPIGWDIDLLKRMGVKVVYSNIGCLDGVSQSAFRKWGPWPVCEICRFRDEPSVCSDERNLAWGALRNHLVDFQVNLGGNRADYNDDPTVHEVPEFYCLDPDFWRPDLEVPAEHRLPYKPGLVRIYHAVGNYSSRTLDQVNIKTTHLIVPAIERLKADGYPVELVFCTNLPNKDVRFYQKQSDIVVDMLTFGFFGANIREAMMLGKPTVCFLRPEWLASMRGEIPEYVAELPVVNATPETVYEVLVDLVTNPARRRALGRRGREFAVKWHSRDAAGRRFDQIYAELMRQRPGLAPDRLSA